MAYKFSLFGWYVGEVPDGTSRSTDIAPSNLGTDNTPGVMRCNWTGSKWVERPYVHGYEAEHIANVEAKKAEAERKAMVVSMRNARLALHSAGLLTSVNTHVQAQTEDVKIQWEYATEIHRNHVLVAAVQTALGWTDQQVDDLFIAASQIQG